MSNPSLIAESTERIRDGVCVSSMGLGRIDASYVEGKGDNGKSNVSLGARLDKADPSYGIHQATEALRIALSKLLLGYAPGQLSEESVSVLTWFRDNTFSISAFCYCGGVSERHTFPPRSLHYMEERIAEVKVRVGSARDFLVWESQVALDLDEVRIVARELECEYRRWVLVNSIEETPEVKLMASIINRLSSYILWLTRELYMNKGIEEKYWAGGVTPFPA